MFPQRSNYPNNDAGYQKYIDELRIKFEKVDDWNRVLWARSLRSSDLKDFLEALKMFRPFELTSHKFVENILKDKLYGYSRARDLKV